MSELDQDIALFQKMREELEAHHKGKWVLICKSELINTFDTFEAAAAEAVTRFGRGPYLIRQIGGVDFVMPASVAFRLDPNYA